MNHWMVAFFTLLGFDVGFMIAIWGMMEAEKIAAKERAILISGKIYRMTLLEADNDSTSV